jgi:hypothetical protein
MFNRNYGFLDWLYLGSGLVGNGLKFLGNNIFFHWPHVGPGSRELAQGLRGCLRDNIPFHFSR